MKKRSIFLAFCFALVGSIPYAVGQDVLTTGNNAGNGTWVCPAGVTTITVECWGAGGRGGTRTSNGSGGGGGGGAYSRSVLTVVPGTTYFFTAGAGSNNANPGGDSYFGNTSAGNPSGALVLAKGGNSVGDNNANGASGGAASSGIGDVRHNGGDGWTTNVAGGGGGGSSAGTGTNAHGISANSTSGAAAPAGGAVGGNGRTSYQGNGSTGGLPGGGGGGAYRTGSSTRTGGAGRHGRVIITMVCPAPELASCTNMVNWQTVTAPSLPGVLTISTCTYQTNFNTINSVVAGSTYRSVYSLGGFITVRSGSSNGPVVAQGPSPLSWTAVTSGTHFVHYNTSTCCGQAQNCGTSSIECTSCTPPAPPSNDLVCDATPITCGQTLSGTTVNATNSGTGEGASVCGVGQATGGVWYSFQGNGEMVLASLCGTSWDSRISVYSGSCSSLTCVGGNDDFGPACTGSLGASYAFQTQVGVTYYIKVHGYITNAAFSLELTCGGTATGTTSPGNVSACVLTSAPTNWSQLAGCTYPYGVNVGAGTRIDRCFEFVATNSSLNWQFGTSTSCSPGSITDGTWSWTCYDISNNVISTSTALSDPMLISNLVPGQTYRICYGYVHANACFSENFAPYLYGQSVLPVDLTSFSGYKDLTENRLTWNTLSERNNYYFTIERSNDAVNWEQIGKVNGSGNSNVPLEYKFDDKKPNQKHNYYRLSQTDIDGTTRVFEDLILFIDNTSDRKVVAVYNMLGQRIAEETKGVKIIEYTDGTRVKVFE